MTHYYSTKPGTSKKQKKREWLRYKDFVLSPYGVIKIKSLGYREWRIFQQRICRCFQRWSTAVVSG
ncbi:hypothetical protein [Symbiopectobacterium sp. RP]|uniref:hypothetical protein n=1 Tax=Symbiopectobacterium sp. RP TaxID=3248553 RepID=UPI003D26BB37